MRSVLLFLSLTLPVSVFAASAAPTGVTTIYKDAAGITRTAEVMTRMESVTYGVKYALQRVAVSPASMGRMAARAVGGPWGAAIVAGMSIYAYVYDDEIGAFRTPSDISCPADHDCSNVASWFVNAASCPGKYPDISSAVACIVTLNTSLTFDRLEFYGNPVQQVYVYGCNAGGSCVYQFPGSVFPSSSSPDKPSNPMAGQLVSANDIGQKVFDGVDDGSLPQSLPQSVANDSVNTGWYASDWPELRDLVTGLQDDLTTADTPESENPFTETQESAFRSPEDKAELVSTSSQPLELPTDYNRESTQLAIEADLNAIKNKFNEGPPSVPPDLGSEVPLIDFETVNLPATFDDSEFDSVGVGVCPAPLTIDALGASINVSYQPFCDLAIRLNPFFVSLGWLSAAFIVFGRGSIV